MLAILAFGLPQTTDDPLVAELRPMFSPNSTCPQPCWQGIRPARTSGTDAISQLKTLPWVTNISAIQGIVTKDSIIRWKWNGLQSSIIDNERDGTIWLHNGLVYSIELPLKVSFAQVWQAAGEPQNTVIIKAPRSTPTVFYHALYANGLTDVFGILPCPLSAWTLLSMRVDVHLTSEQSPSDRQQTPSDRRGLCN
ncbi:MAG: hypothetical protein R3E39_27745 [Anaerolineae bacterium]